jgi:hypothetical protein
MTTTELSDCVAIQQRPQAPPYQIVVAEPDVRLAPHPAAVWRCAPRLGTATGQWSASARLAGEGALRAKVSFAGTYSIVLKTHGYLYQERGKKNWVAAVIMGDEGYRDLPPGLSATKLTPWINEKLAKDKDYAARGLGKISERTVRRTLKTLYANKARGGR